jgi:hypothetical protein
MQPDRVDLTKHRLVSGDGSARAHATGGADGDVGDFRQGSPASRWALARYLVGRAIGESAGSSLLVVGLLILAGAGLLWWAGYSVPAVLVALIALGVLGMRSLLRALLRRLTHSPHHAAAEQRLRALVRETRADVLRELRRIGLPGRVVTLPLLGLRLARRRRRADTMARLRRFQLDNVVRPARLDELHMLLRTSAPTPPPFTPPPSAPPPYPPPQGATPRG